MIRKTLLATVVASTGLAGAANANHIDFIVDGGFAPITVTGSATNSNTQTGDPGNIIGAEREVTLSTDAGTSSVVLPVPPGPGPVGPNPAITMDYTGTGVTGGSLMLNYDGAGSAGLGGLDFDTVWDLLRVDFDTVMGTGDLTVEVADTLTNVDSVTTTVASAGSYDFAFGSFGVDFGSVDRITLTLSAEDDFTFGINEVTREVPLPGTVWLGLAGLLGLGVSRRLNRKG